MINRKQILLSAVALATCVLLSQLAAAAAEPGHVSAFGCSNLQEISELSMIEGKDGMFFRILADMRLQHAFTDQTVDMVAAMANALKANGTTLIYAPIPTKSQVLPDLLPTSAKLYGFDPSIAQAVYDDVIVRLNDKGVAAANIATAMREMPANEFGELPFFQSDFHWTGQGADAAAKAIGALIKALPEYADVIPVAFDVKVGEVDGEFSSMRNLLQQHCLQNVPLVRAHVFQVTRAELAVKEDEAVDIFGGDSNDTIALVGTSYSDKAISNFAGLLEHWSSMPIENYSISGGNQFGAILSYITSKEFQKQRPRFLIWENPIYNNLGQYGDIPWHEIIAAASGDCERTIGITSTGANKFSADLSGLDLGGNDVLLADAGQEGSREATFDFTGDDGEIRTRTIKRDDRMRSTGRYFMSLGGLPKGALKKVLVTFDGSADAQTTLKACKINLGEQS